MLAPTTPAPPTEVQPDPRIALNGRWIGLACGALLVLYLLGAFIGGELGSFMVAGLEVLPFAVVALLAYLGAEQIWARVVAVVALAVVVGAYALTALGLSVATVITPGRLSVQPGGLLSLALIVIGMTLAVVVGGLMALPAVRRTLSRTLPIDPGSFVHLVALVLVVSLLLIGVMPLLVLAAPPILTALTNLGSGSLLGDQNAASQLRAELYGLIWTVPCAVVAVGWGVRRRLQDALQRLGLVRPTARQVGAALGLAVLAVVASRGLDLATAAVWDTFGWPRTNEAAFGQLLAFAMSPIGAVVVGVSAGLGEEVAVRGVLQPRLGLLLSNLFFTSLHALQYNWDALLSVFLLGLLMGVVRRRSNTTTSAIVHGTYDCLLVLLTVLQIPGFS